jgi:hypothetical protein
MEHGQYIAERTQKAVYIVRCLWLQEMLVKLMTSENDKSHGSMMLRVGAIAFGLGTLIYTGLGMRSGDLKF